jgi:Sulfotransferase domain
VFVKLERYIRGRADWRRLKNADCVVVSFGKSGRTWLRVLLSRYYQLKCQLPPHSMLIYDNLHRLKPAVPIIHFTHDNYIRDYTGNSSKADFYDKRVVLMARDPRDTAVSQYFQWKHRMKARKKIINQYPLDDSISIYDFAMSDSAGLPKIIRFMNGWAGEIERIPHHHILRYEGLRADTASTLGGLLRFLSESPTDDQLADCVQYGSVENMRRLELSKAGQQMGGTRLQPGDPSNPDSYKVRRARVGGYADYFTPAETETMDALVDRDLAPIFGYKSRFSQYANSVKNSESTALERPPP